MKIPNGYEIIQRLEGVFPKNIAMNEDPIGLQVGTLNKKISRVLITLDPLEEVIDEAIGLNIDLIIAHHPIIYRPLKNLVTDYSQGRIFQKAMKHDIAIYIAHTNFDIAPGGMNDALASSLKLRNVTPLVTTFQEPLLKLMVYVPESHADKVLMAICNAGAGEIGEYSHCTFTTNGTGTFKPGEQTTPFIGEIGKLERVNEVRIETILPLGIKNKVIKEMVAAHPYEEVAYDLFECHQKGISHGLGRMGTKEDKLTLKALVDEIKEIWNLDGVRVVGDINTLVQKIAIVGGDGNKYVHTAKRSGADVYVTGDLYYHTAHEAMNLGLPVIDVGHHAEKIVIDQLCNYLNTWSLEEKWEITTFPSQINTNPFKFY